MPHTVLITETLDDTCAKWLDSCANVVWHAHDEPGLATVLAKAQGAVVRTYTQVDDAFLDQAPLLKVVGRAGVGLDNIDLDACRERGVQVVYTPDANTQAVIEYVFGLILDHYRPRYTLSQAVEPSDFHQLRKEQVGRQLDELTLGILGFGRIGKRLGKAAHALGIKILANDLLPAEQLQSEIDYPIELVDKDQLYRESDILSIHVDGRAENHHLLDTKAFAQLKPEGLFINAARGMLVNDEALAVHLKNCPASFAVLDVHDPEPPQATNPLFGLPNARLLPHLASRTDCALQNMSWVVRDVMAVLDGHPPQYPAN